ncbi:MAG: HlyD family efflux transporter periplasmic adaptor subunit [Planctomycetota bacterium]
MTSVPAIRPDLEYPESVGDAERKLDGESVAMIITPKWIKRTMVLLVIALIIAPFALLLAPWVQTVRGAGEVVAFTPNEREQQIEAPIKGRIVKLHVIEGDVVRQGDLLFEMSDIDPLRLQQIETQLESEQNRRVNTENQLFQAEASADNFRTVGAWTVDAFDQARITAERGVEAAEAGLRAANAQVALDKAQVERKRSLIGDGAVSQRQLEVAEADYDTSLAKVEEAKAKVEAAKADLEAAKSKLTAIRAETDAKVNEAVGKVEETKGKIQEIDQKIAGLAGELRRQQTQIVRAPRDGAIFRVNAFTEGTVASEGDPIVTLVPDTEQRSVEIFIDGNDAPLVSVGSTVRLQFEGWPAVQFAGWPSVAVGTFGGKVAFVDATDNGQGQFRILVVPDENDDQDWPSRRFLRQGVRAKGWVLLNEVSVGWELWRQLNGFPPVIDREEPGAVARKRVK